MNICRITTLIENAVYQRELISEHGFSLFIELDDTKILFDAGQGPNFIKNAVKMNINLLDTHSCIISHGHYDHSGGLLDFMKINDKTKIWINEHAFAPKYNNKKVYIGIPSAERLNRDVFHSADGITCIMENVYILPAAPLYYEEDNHTEGFFIEKEGFYIKDDFIDEQSLVIIKNGSLIIISGCSHRGICNILKSALDYFKLPISLVIGGFHLKNENEGKIKKIINILNSFNIQQIGVSHCTGIDEYCLIKNFFNGNLCYNYTGNSMRM